jgi:hypothetical protein
MDEEKRRVTASILVAGIEKRGSQKPPILHSLSSVFHRKLEIVLNLVSD